MALDPRFFLIYALEDYFVNKDTGFPLANGVVTFYEDKNRTKLKTIYTLNGMPPYTTASYVPLPNPMTLSSVGTPQDADGNNVAIYLFPFEGQPDDNNDTLDLYYIDVKSQTGVPQFTRSGIPNIAEEEPIVPVESIENYIPNPQFLAHISPPANGAGSDGTISSTVTTIAQGGWTFERPSNLATDKVTFYRFDAPLNGVPSGNPRYALDVECTVPAPTDAYKSVRVKFSDVNTFAVAGQITIGFEAISVSGIPFVLRLSLVRNFGTNGSLPPPPQIIGTFDITDTWTYFSTPFSPGINTGFNLGDLDDDFIQLSFDFPTNTVFHARITNSIITPGAVLLTTFPITTASQALAPTLAGNPPPPEYLNADLYLPIRNGENGYEPDDSDIGNIFATSKESTALSLGELPCDGSGYIYSAYSSDKIPFRRLGDKLFNTSLNCPKFGTSPQFAQSSSFNYSTSSVLLATNTPGLQTATADVNSGFTFSTIANGASDRFFKTYSQGATSTVVTVVGNAKGLVVTLPSNGTSGFTVTPVRNETNAFQIFTINTAPGVPSAGSYFTFQMTGAISYYVWYRVNGVGADPVQPGTGIRVDILSTYTTADVARATMAAMAGYQTSNIVVTGTPPVSSAWTFYATAQKYYVWYIINNIGTDPLIANSIGIPVSITSAMTNAQIALATIVAINKYSYAVPDLRGLTIRGFDSSGQWDTDYLTRISRLANGGGNALGTLEIDSILHHEHATDIPSAGVSGPGLGLTPITNTGISTRISTFMYTTSTTTDIASHRINQGETRGSNMALNYIIKY